ncbi:MULTISPECIES: GDP-mannose 4,6-dehydratase [Bacillus]|nr:MULTISPECIES: GDP-mannose 4,6-dehydratase [Bacillus]MED1097690.1 GDP-mannose 4,6-dehydratase [Bacillus capparidis]
MGSHLTEHLLEKGYTVDIVVN